MHLQSHHRRVDRFEVLVGGAAVVAAAVAFWVTARADFLAHPYWLAVQKADLIAGPVGVGLYWRRRRPQSRFWPMLIVFGFIGVPYVLQSADSPALFGTGVLWEGVIYLATQTLILAFPSGRLDSRIDRILVAAAALTVTVPLTVVVLISPQIGADGSISGCLARCPENGLSIASDASLASRLFDFGRGALITIALVTATLLAWRMARGTPPRRRALAIGAPVALVFLLMQATYQTMQLVGADDTRAYSVVQWTIAGARAAIWYGFLLALVAAELFAGRVLRRIVEQSLRRPSLHELESILRGPLGDPSLRLTFWQPRAGAWADADGVVVEQRSQPAGRAFTEVRRDGRRAAGIVHDAQLDDDPELLQAAGAVALLAQENAELEAAWNESLVELRDSRRRIAAASDDERRRLERDLHDGAQQRLVALAVRLGTIAELGAAYPALQRRLRELEVELHDAIDEVREIAHGIYPTVLGHMGLAAALQSVTVRSSGRVRFRGAKVGRYPSEIESVVYYCCLEAIQNAVKHGGPAVHVSVSVRESDGELLLDVRDDGPGFDVQGAHDGMGLNNMRDRLGACDGRLEITSALGRGTVVSGAVPLGGAGPLASPIVQPSPLIRSP